MNAPHDFEEARKKADTYHNVLNAKFDELLSDRLKSVYVQKRSRVKSSASLAKKLEDRRSRSSMYTFDNVTDMVGFRFVCHFQNDVEVVVSALLDRIFTGVDSDMRYLREAKMYASTSPHHRVARDNLQKIFERHLDSAQSRHPGIKLEIEEKDSRYTSVHLVVERFDKQKFEVQVRNVFEDAWAEIEHALKYKSKGPLTVSLSQHLQVLNSFAQACSEYSERILADAVREGPGGSPQVRDLDARADMQGMPPAAIAAYELAAGLVAKELFTDAVAALTAFIDKHAALLADPAVRYFIFMERALVYLKLKETRLALKDYELLQAENADRALIYWRMGDARRIDGDFADAARFFELVADKINSPSNTAEEKRHLANWPYTLSHAHWRVGRVQKALEVVRDARDRRIVPFVDMRPDPLTGESRDWGQLTFTNCLVYYLWDLARVEKRDPGPTEMREYEDAHLLLKEHKVDNGAHWEPLDTLLIVTEALNKSEETVRYADQLEGMIVYDDEGRVRVRLKTSTGFELKDVPIEEIEMVRAHIHHARVKFGKRTPV